MALKCKTCIYRKKDMKKFLFYCKKRHIRVGERRKSCELYEPKQKGGVAATPKKIHSAYTKKEKQVPFLG